VSAERSLDRLYLLPEAASPGTALDQAGLRDGGEIIRGYLDHNELGLAFDHLLYMLIEPPIEVTPAELADIDAVGRTLGQEAVRWQSLRIRREVERPMVSITSGGLDDPRVCELLEYHMRTARAETAVGSAHALDLEALRAPDVAFWSAWHGATLVGVGALKSLSPTHGEIKSMHTAISSRRQGVGTALLRHIVQAARAAGMTRLSLETGSWGYFDSARALYRKQGFIECAPFGSYVDDPNGVFMTLELAGTGALREDS